VLRYTVAPGQRSPLTLVRADARCAGGSPCDVALQLGFGAGCSGDSEHTACPCCALSGPGPRRTPAVNLIREVCAGGGGWVRREGVRGLSSATAFAEGDTLPFLREASTGLLAGPTTTY
jgi:hypothetical protein